MDQLIESDDEPSKGKCDKNSPKNTQMPRNVGGRPKKVIVWDRQPYVVHARLRADNAHLIDFVREIVKEHPDNVRKQIKVLFSSGRLPAATGRKRAMSFKSAEKYLKTLIEAIGTLGELNMKVRNLTELSHKHVLAITRNWESKGKSPSVLTSLNTVLRRIGVLIGKPQMVLVLKELLLNPDAGIRHSSLTTPRSWEALSINPEAVFAVMELECEVTAHQLRLGWAFGLRMQEQLCLRPHRALVSDATILQITDGTKGGRPREIHIHSEYELQLVLRAQELAFRHPQRILSPLDGGKPRKLEPAIRHYHYLCHKIGLTKAGRFGATSHCARHSFAIRRYEAASGMQAPVLGGSAPASDIDKDARMRVAQELGHGRRSVTGAYIGTTRGMALAQKAKLRRLMEREEILGRDNELLSYARTGQLTTVSLVGDAAQGEKLGGIVFVLCESANPVPLEVVAGLLGRMGVLLGRKCVRLERSSVEMSALPTFEIVALGRAGTRSASD